MTQQFLYIAAGAGWSVDLGTTVVRLGSENGWSDALNRGDNGSAQISFDDPGSAIGHSGDGIRGLQYFVVKENAAPVNDRRIGTYVITERDYERGGSDRASLRTGTDRVITATVMDLNSILGFRRPHGSDGNRAAETVSARLTWLLGSTYAEFFDNGFVTYPGTTMDANDYRTQTVGDVLADCAKLVKYNYGLYYDEAAGQISLWFRDSNASTSWSSTLYLTNDLTYIDSGPASVGPGKVVAASAKLTRSPAGVASTAIVPYSAGFVAPTSGTVASKYRTRDLVAPDANTKSASVATTLGNNFLAISATEEDTLAIDYEIPAAYVNAIRPGMRVPVMFTHLGGMDSPVYNVWTWVRVLTRQVAMGMSPETYQVHLIASPQEDAGVVAPVAPPACPNVLDDFANRTTVDNSPLWPLVPPAGGQWLSTSTGHAWTSEIPTRGSLWVATSGGTGRMTYDPNRYLPSTGINDAEGAATASALPSPTDDEPVFSLRFKTSLIPDGASSHVSVGDYETRAATLLTWQIEAAGNPHVPATPGHILAGGLVIGSTAFTTDAHFTGSPFPPGYPPAASLPSGIHIFFYNGFGVISVASVVKTDWVANAWYTVYEQILHSGTVRLKVIPDGGFDPGWQVTYASGVDYGNWSGGLSFALDLHYNDHFNHGADVGDVIDTYFGDPTFGCST